MDFTGFSNFENDTANNFVSDVILNGYGMIRIAIERITDDEDPASILECEEALIAVEFIAAARNRPARDFPDEANEWLSLNAPEGSMEYEELIALTDKAADAIDRILTDSELKELWDDTDAHDIWFNAQQELQNRLLGD